MSCSRCGKCCRRSPCSIPVMHMDALRALLVTEFGKPAKVGHLDIVSVMFRYEEEFTPDGRVSGYFMPIARGKSCMWLTKKKGEYGCRLFWNKTAELLVGFAEQVVAKGKGCSYGGRLRVPIIPMVYRNGLRGVAKLEEVTA